MFLGEFASLDACMLPQQQGTSEKGRLWNEGKEEGIKSSSERLAGGKKTTGNQAILMLFLQILQR